MSTLGGMLRYSMRSKSKKNTKHYYKKGEKTYNQQVRESNEREDRRHWGYIEYGRPDGSGD